MRRRRMTNRLANHRPIPIVEAGNVITGFLMFSDDDHHSLNQNGTLFVHQPRKVSRFDTRAMTATEATAFWTFRVHRLEMTRAGETRAIWIHLSKLEGDWGQLSQQPFYLTAPDLLSIPTLKSGGGQDDRRG